MMMFHRGGRLTTRKPPSLCHFRRLNVIQNPLIDTSKFVKSINNTLPDSNGNININPLRVCWCSIDVSQNYQITANGQYIPITIRGQIGGDFQLQDSYYCRVPVDGNILICGSIMYADGVEDAYCGVSVNVTRSGSMSSLIDSYRQYYTMGYGVTTTPMRLASVGAGDLISITARVDSVVDETMVSSNTNRTGFVIQYVNYT